MSGHEENSIKEAGGCAAGFTGRFFNFNADAEARLADALMTVGKYVQGESGCLLGHIKAAVYVGDGKGITLNLIDMDNGVEHHGSLPRCDEVSFNFMCAVLDVDEYDLTHKMLHAIDDSGIDYSIDKESLGHHHDHDHGEGECDDPNCGCHHHDLASMIDEKGHFSHEHHHHHGHGEECHCHCHDDDGDRHEHGEGECCCHRHHDGEEHGHHGHGEECRSHEEEAKEKKKKGLFGFLKRK